jgi:hypothetical protein
VGLRSGIGVLDVGKNALVVFAEGGERRDLPLDTLLQRSATRITDLNQMLDGGWIYSYTERTDNGWQERLVHRVEGRDTVLATTATAPVRPVRLVCGIVLFPEPPVFWPTVRWAMSGEYAAFAVGAEYEVTVLRHGAQTHALKREILPERATLAHARSQPIGRRVCALYRSFDLSVVYD